MDTCHKNIPCPKFLLQVGVLLSDSVFPCQDTHCYMLHEEQQTISVPSNFGEKAHVLLVNISCAHLYIFSASGVSSGLANRVTLTLE